MEAGFNIKAGVLVEYTGQNSVVHIPEGVRIIGTYAFAHNQTITQVILPDTVISIGEGAFLSCPRLERVAVSSNLEEIQENAFLGCTALGELALPDTLQRLGAGAFAECVHLRKLTCRRETYWKTCIPQANPFWHSGCPPLTQLADNQGFLIFAGVLYDYYGSSQELVIPQGVKRIVPRVFASVQGEWGKKWDFVRVEVPDSVEVIGEAAFAYAPKLRTVTLPKGVTLEENVFAGCSGLGDENGFFVYEGVAHGYYGHREQVVVPEGVKALGEALFCYHQTLRRVTLPEGLEQIGGEAFRCCNQLTQVNLPEGLREIGSMAFYGCERLEQVSLPSSLREIGREAFACCRALAELSGVRAGVRIGDGAFLRCKGLADENGFVIVNHTVYDYFGQSPAVVVPEGITALGSHAFSGDYVTSVQLPSTLKTIHEAFSGCRALTEITLPEGIVGLESGAFSGCNCLERITLPQSLKEIGDLAFYACPKLKEIQLPSGVEHIGADAWEGWEEEETEENEDEDAWWNRWW